MIRLFKNLKDTWKIWRTVKDSPAIFKVVEDIFKFVETTHKEQRPMVTKIVLLNMADGTKMGDFVSLWAGIGEENPIDRAKGLKAQTTELKRLLQLSIDGELTNEDKKQVEMVLQIFD